MTEREAIDAQKNGPNTVESLSSDLRALGLAQGMVVLVHASLSSLGWTSGGPHAVVHALRAAVGESGTIVMPTHSGDLSDPARWENPPVPESWWQTIRDTMPAYEADRTRTRGMGATAEVFRDGKNVLRSSHPAGSFAAEGPVAAQIANRHSLSWTFGEESPLARLYDLDGWVLLLGVGHEHNTSMHLAEYRADWSGKRTQTEGAPIMRNGVRVWASYEDVDLDSDDFPEIGRAYERSRESRSPAEGITDVRTGRVGRAECRLLRQRPMVDYATEWMAKNRSDQSGG